MHFLSLKPAFRSTLTPGIAGLPPGRPVKLLFKDGEAARAAHEGYVSRDKTVLGQPVAATTPRHSIKPFGWTVTLLGVPDAATKKDIVHGLSLGTRPSHVDVGEKVARADVDDVADGLRERLEAYGPLLKWQYPLPSARRTKIGVLFEYPAAAEDAAKALQGQRLTFKNGTQAKLSAIVYTTILLRIPVTQYETKRALIEEAMAFWKQKHVEFLTAPTKDNQIIFKVAGNDTHYQALLDAAQDVEDILDGHLVA